MELLFFFAAAAIFSLLATAFGSDSRDPLPSDWGQSARNAWI
jgi:hypothetical protein